jgi:actin-related protein
MRFFILFLLILFSHCLHAQHISTTLNARGFPTSKCKYSKGVMADSDPDCALCMAELKKEEDERKRKEQERLAREKQELEQKKREELRIENEKLEKQQQERIAIEKQKLQQRKQEERRLENEDLQKKKQEAEQIARQKQDLEQKKREAEKFKNEPLKAKPGDKIARAKPDTPGKLKDLLSEVKKLAGYIKFTEVPHSTRGYKEVYKVYHAITESNFDFDANNLILSMKDDVSAENIMDDGRKEDMSFCETIIYTIPLSSVKSFSYSIDDHNPQECRLTIVFSNETVKRVNKQCTGEQSEYDYWDTGRSILVNPADAEKIITLLKQAATIAGAELKE